MAAKTSWHRRGTKLRDCQRMYAVWCWCLAGQGGVTLGGRARSRAGRRRTAVSSRCGRSLLSTSVRLANCRMPCVHFTYLLHSLCCCLVVRTSEPRASWAWRHAGLQSDSPRRSTDKLGMTPLHLAAENGYTSLVDLLVHKHQAQVDAYTLVSLYTDHIRRRNRRHGRWTWANN